MKNVIGIVIFFVTGIILGGCILQLALIKSILLGAICFTVYHLLVTKELVFPVIGWGVLAAIAFFLWMML